MVRKHKKTPKKNEITDEKLDELLKMYYSKEEKAPKSFETAILKYIQYK